MTYEPPATIKTEHGSQAMTQRNDEPKQQVPGITVHLIGTFCAQGRAGPASLRGSYVALKTRPLPSAKYLPPLRGIKGEPVWGPLSRYAAPHGTAATQPLRGP